jgi:hypothetical protein
VEIVYVSCGASAARVLTLKTELAGRRFKLVEGPKYLSQNAARNLGARTASPVRDYLIFIDNDVIVESGWIKALVDCALETGAGIVGPLIQEGDPAKQIIHMTGGVYREIDTQSGRVAFERHLNGHRALSSIQSPMVRSSADYVEGHCLLVARRTLDACGGWDEALETMCEYIDLCLRARHLGYAVLVEPRAVVTYGSLDGLTVEDVALFLKRWDINATRATFDHFALKRGLRPGSELVMYGENFVRQHRGVLSLFDSSAEWAKSRHKSHSLTTSSMDELKNQTRLSGYSIAGCAALEWLCVALSPHTDELDEGQASPCQIGLRAAQLLLADGAHVSLIAAALMRPLLTSGRITRSQAGAIVANAERRPGFGKFGNFLNSTFVLQSTLPEIDLANSPASVLRAVAVLSALRGCQSSKELPPAFVEPLKLLESIGFHTLAGAWSSRH